MCQNCLQPPPLSQLTRISPSRFCALRICALKEIWAASRVPVYIPAAPASRLGTIIHNLIEAAYSGRLPDEVSMERMWGEEVAAHEREMLGSPLEKHFVPLSKNAQNYKVKQIMGFNLVRPLLKGRSEKARSEHQATPEIWFETADKIIGGKVDVVVREETGVKIIDYKTGKIVENDEDENTIKQDYIDQLKMYSGLYFESTGAWPAELTIVSINGKHFNVPFTKDGCISLLAEAKARFSEINELIANNCSHDQLASPSPDACSFCGYRPACFSYWGQRQDTKDWPADLIGKIKEIKMLENGLVKINVVSKDKEFVVRGLSPSRNEYLLGAIDEVLYCNLGFETIENHFKERPLTVGYKVS